MERTYRVPPNIMALRVMTPAPTQTMTKLAANTAVCCTELPMVEEVATYKKLYAMSVLYGAYLRTWIEASK